MDREERGMTAVTWEGEQLQGKRRQAIDAFRSAMSEAMLEHHEWIQMTDIAWQAMSERLHDAQLDVIRSEKFGKTRLSLQHGADRVERFDRYQRVLRAMNFLFKCFEVDWSAFLSAVVELVEGTLDGSGCYRQSARSEPHDPGASVGERHDASGSGQSERH